MILSVFSLFPFVEAYLRSSSGNFFPSLKRIYSYFFLNGMVEILFRWNSERILKCDLQYNPTLLQAISYQLVQTSSWIYLKLNCAKKEGSGQDEDINLSRRTLRMITGSHRKISRKIQYIQVYIFTKHLSSSLEDYRTIWHCGQFGTVDNLAPDHLALRV